VNGWKVTNDFYVQDVQEAMKYIESNWFRPPYGRMRGSQAKALQSKFPNLRVAMWDVLSGDFDTTKTGAWCASQVIRQASPGSIVVFHDSAKALDRLSNCLPLAMKYFYNLGYRFEALPIS
jgi:peptidoglycan/xylan/chitin deacetylase (PgdA/CDA1 family)